MNRLPPLAAAALAALALLGSPASGQPAPTPERADEVHWLRLGIELVGEALIGAVWYWSQTGLQTEDWELDWDRESWTSKLSDPGTVRFDTNRFFYNAVDHPFVGAVNYQIGRSNGLGLGGAMLVNLGMTLFWEYVIEFKEIISLNDIIINNSAGLAIGEPLLQLGALARASSGPGWTLVGALAAPFDAAHGLLDGPGPARVAPWHRLELAAGAGRWASGDDHWLEGTLALDVAVVAVPGFGRPGLRSRRVALGGWNRMSGRLAFGDGEPDAPTVAARFLTRTSLVGHIWRDVADSQVGLVGSETLLALGTGFTYDARRIVGERDHLAVAHLAGGQVAIVSHHGATTVSWDAGLYGDFDMIDGHVFGPVLPFHPVLPYGSALAVRGYYFGFGGTLDTRLRVERGRLALDLDARGHAARSLDGVDRHELGGPDDPHGISDQRLFGSAGLGLRLGPGPVRLRVVAEGAIRRGAWSDRSRATGDGSVGLEIAAEL